MQAWRRGAEAGDKGGFDAIVERLRTFGGEPDPGGERGCEQIKARGSGSAELAHALDLGRAADAPPLRELLHQPDGDAFDDGRLQ
jgi:hypothetical protein